MTNIQFQYWFLHCQMAVVILLSLGIPSNLQYTLQMSFVEEQSISNEILSHFVRKTMAMSSEVTLDTAQFRLQEWAAQIRNYQNRPNGISV